MADYFSACLVPEEGPEDDHVGDEAQNGQGAVEDYQSVVRHYWQPGGRGGIYGGSGHGGACGDGGGESCGDGGSCWS